MIHSKYFAVFTGFGCCIAIALGTTLLSSRQLNSPKTSQVISNSVTSEPSRITAVGRIEPLNKLIRVAPPSSHGRSRIKFLHVSEGDYVKKGQLIAEFDVIDERRSNLRIAEQNLAITKRRYDVIKGESEASRNKLKRLEYELIKADKDLERYRSLHQDGAFSLSDLDKVQLIRDKAHERLEEHKASFERVVGQNLGTSLLKEAVGQANIQLAEAELDKARHDFEQAMVRAPQDGTILKILKHTGEEVDQGGLLLMGDTSQMVTVAEVYENDVKFIRDGQQALITSKALTLPAGGKVISVGSLVYKNDIVGDDPTADVDTRIFEVRILMDDSDELRKMSRLQVDVEIQRSPVNSDIALS